LTFLSKLVYVIATCSSEWDSSLKNLSCEGAIHVH
jgi:hypothetical protein